MLVSVGLPVSANAINKGVGVHTKVSLNVRHRVVSPARIAQRTASLEIRLKLQHTSGLRGSHQHLMAEAPTLAPSARTSRLCQGRSIDSVPTYNAGFTLGSELISA